MTHHYIPMPRSAQPAVLVAVVGLATLQPARSRNQPHRNICLP